MRRQGLPLTSGRKASHPRAKAIGRPHSP